MPRDRGLRYWLPAYLTDSAARRRVRNNPGTTHVIYLMCDHYEPKHAIKQSGQDVERVKAWSEGYPKFFSKCKKQFGHAPKYSWFYPPHHGLEHLTPLKKMVFQGLGEIELHYHHDNDTSASLTKDLRATIRAYNRRGLLLCAGEQPQPSFAFIHGDWALDNSHPQGLFCGVNNELEILQQLGCWGDMTMPSSNECQTRKINSIYYAEDDPSSAKSHDQGHDATRGRTDPKGLFMLQGPLGIYWSGLIPKMENAGITRSNWGTPARARAWVNSAIHVKGRPEWLFVKLHAHGAVERDFDPLFGDKALAMHRTLNEMYNDGHHYKLHYVTAREAYNICKAAEHGHDGDPDQYRNFLLPPQPASRYFTATEHDLICCTETTLELAELATCDDPSLDIHGMAVRRIEGAFSHIVISHSGRRISAKRPTLPALSTRAATITLYFNEAPEIKTLSGCTIVNNEADKSSNCITLSVDHQQIDIELH
ncbi:MAG: hypothetical protein GXP10_06190 [Gammaproteobacteria bacterium]|nr:hypothetical protein [Gammaproteobacteria bacterium]